jgi:hypothetical protein
VSHHLPDTSLIAKTVYEDRLVTYASPSISYRGPRLLHQESFSTSMKSSVTSPPDWRRTTAVFKNGNKIVETSAAHFLSNDGTGQRRGVGYWTAIPLYGRPPSENRGARQHPGRPDRLYRSDLHSLSCIEIDVRIRVFIDWLLDHLRRLHAGFDPLAVLNDRINSRKTGSCALNGIEPQTRNWHRRRNSATFQARK